MVPKEIFQNIGLSDKETEVYLLLLGLKEALASKIANKTRISRPHVYDSLNKLVEKGMASYVIKNGKRYFKPTTPEKIKEYLKEREKAVEQYLPELNQLYSQIKEKPNVEVYEGPEGIKTALFDMIKVGKEMLSFNTIGDKILDYVPDHVINQYYSERKKHKIHSRQFYSGDVKLLKHPMARYKKLPGDYNPVLLFVYGDCVCMFILTGYPITIKIQSKEAADLYKRHFEVLWKTIK